MQTIEIKKQNQEKQLERTYPYMGISDGITVWFVEPCRGIAITCTEPILKLSVSGGWTEENFTPMQGDYTFTFNNE